MKIEKNKKEVLTEDCLMLDIDVKVALRAAVPLGLVSSFGCAPAEARLLGRFKEEAEVTVPLGAIGSALVPFSRAILASLFTSSPSTLFFMPSPRAPVAGKERL